MRGKFKLPSRAFHLKNFLSDIARRDIFNFFWVPEVTPKSRARQLKAHASARPLKFWLRSTSEIELVAKPKPKPKRIL